VLAEPRQAQTYDEAARAAQKSRLERGTAAWDQTLRGFATMQIDSEGLETARFGKF